MTCSSRCIKARIPEYFIQITTGALPCCSLSLTGSRKSLSVFGCVKHWWGSTWIISDLQGDCRKDIHVCLNGTLISVASMRLVFISLIKHTVFVNSLISQLKTSGCCCKIFGTPSTPGGYADEFAPVAQQNII